MRAIFTVVTLLSALASQAYSNSEQGHGLIPPTQKDLDYIHKHWKKIETVQHNQLGASRIALDYQKRGEKAPKIAIAKSTEEEFGTAAGGSATSVTLPATVFNNRLPSFPNIGNQGGEGSCVAWATTYYQATHEIGLVNGFNNEEYQENILSPSWTYNMINGGQDNGSQFTNAYALLAQNGAPTTYAFPYTAGKYLAWDLKTEDWLTALSNRMSPPQYVAGLNTSPQDLTAIKTLLNNGHVLTFGTYMNSWVYSTVGNTGVLSPYTGQKAVSYMSGTNQGGHMATIVGYDDNIWIDINGNGKIDPGETGAFLIANSWGAGWGNGGYIWMSYDAFLSQSAVTPAPIITSRQPLAVLSNSYALSAVPKAANYQPQLVAQFQLSQTERNHISISAGVSSSSQTTPATYFQSGAIIDQGGLYDFAGAFTSTPEKGTFLLDLTDLVPLGTRYYFVLGNSFTPTTLNSFSLLDLVNQVVVPVSATQLPQTTTWNTLAPYIDYTMPAVPITPTTPQVCWLMNNQTVTGVIPLMTNAPSTINAIWLYVDSKLITILESTPYIWLYDTSTLSNGAHQISFEFYYRGVQVGPTANFAVTVQN